MTKQTQKDELTVKVLSVPGERGAPGPPGRDGESIQGPPGRDGVTPSEDQLRKLIGEVLKTTPNLVGPRGPEGPRGERGKEGPRGGDGVPGPKGEPGPKGDPGESDIPGPEGPRGPQGEKGGGRS